MPVSSADLSVLVDKYAKPGPRYTSYPPANRFIPCGVGTSAQRLLADTRQDSGALSLYFHIPFCEARCWYCGCHNIITRNHSQADDYLDLLEAEMGLLRQHLKAGRAVEQIHLGGGTPNFLSPKQIDRLADMIRVHFSVSSDAEISVELDPRQLVAEQVKAFQAMGVNRASFGIQDCNPEVQAAINREQPQAENERAMQLLREANMQAINVDLIYGLPKQSCESFRHTIETVLALKPERVTLFSYAHVPWIKPAQRMLEKATLPSAQEKLTLFMQAITQLESAGMRYIGMDHFARPDDELVHAQQAGTLQRNFQGYSTRAGCEILGMGISSISQSHSSYRQNIKDLSAYAQSLKADTLPLERGYELSDEDMRRRTIIMELMCNLHLNYARMSERLGVEVASHYAEECRRLEEFERDGLLQRDDAGVHITELGRYFIRNIAMTFDATLREGEQGFSKTV